MNRKYIFLWIFAILLLMTACTKSKKPHPRTITVTIEPLQYFTEQIAGREFTVKTMVQPGNSPEDYEPTPRQMVELSHTLLYIKVGNIGFERTWMKRLLANAPQVKVIDSSKGIAQAWSAPGTPDPHTWMSCKSARIISSNICEALIQADPRDSMIFRQNLRKLLRRINKTDREVRQLLKAPGRKRCKAFVIYHPILTYFARDYHLEQLPMEEEGREPGTREMEQLIERARKLQVKTIFIQKEFSPRNAMTIALALGAEPVEIDPLNYDWNQEMLRIARMLK